MIWNNHETKNADAVIWKHASCDFSVFVFFFFFFAPYIRLRKTRLQKVNNVSEFFFTAAG